MAQYIHTTAMSEDHALSVPRSKRTVFASSKLLDPQNTAKLIRSHKHAIECKRTAELANKELGGAENGSPDSRPSGNYPSLSTPPRPPPAALSSPETQSKVNKSHSTTEKVGGSDKESENSGDEAIERRKHSSLSWFIVNVQ